MHLKRQRLLLAIAAAAAQLGGTAAQACGGTQTMSIIHDAAPDPIPENVIVLEVAISNPNPNELYYDGLEATVLQTVQGSVSGPTIILRQRWVTSCDAPFHNGTSGLIVGIYEGEDAGRSVITPFLTPKGWMLKETEYGLTDVQIGSRKAEPAKASQYPPK